MIEPLLPKAHPPGPAGWPIACLRLEFHRACKLDEAAFALAEVSRRLYLGVVAQFEGVDLFAYPHQTVAEICTTFTRLRQMQEAAMPPPISTPAGGERWTGAQKLAVINEIRVGGVPRDIALERYALSDEELTEWERRLEEGGVPALAALRRAS